MKHPTETRQWHDLYHRLQLTIAWHELDGYIVEVKGAARPLTDRRCLWRLRVWLAPRIERECTAMTWTALQRVNARKNPTPRDVGAAKRLCVDTIVAYSRQRD